MRISTRALAFVATLSTLILPAACGSDGGEETGATTVPSQSSTAPSQAPAPRAGTEYCARIADYDKATDSFDTTSVTSMIDSFSRAADAAAAAAKVAPSEIRREQQRMADAAAALVAEIKKRNPKTQAELQAATSEVQPQLQARYGSLDAETAKVVEFAKRECGVDAG